jgi:hypothetical protein
VEAVHAPRSVVVLGRELEPVGDHDALDHEHAVAIEHLADGLGPVAVRIDFDLARLQRACVRAGQSAGSGSDNVVERRGPRRHRAGIHVVVSRDLVVDAELHGPVERRQEREPLRATLSVDAHA